MASPLRITFKVDGTPELLRALADMAKKHPGAMAASIYTEVLGVLRRARPNVPVDTSLLVNSEWASLPDPESSHPQSDCGYAAPYAVPVHERTEVHHQVGKAGWLRDEMQRTAAGFAERVLARALAYQKQGITRPQPDSRIPTAPDVEVMLAKVKSYLARDTSRSKHQRTIAYGRVQKLLDVHQQRQRKKVPA